MRTAEGLVELMDEGDQITYMHIEELAPEDRRGRVRAEGARVQWIARRQARRPLPPSPGPAGQTEP
jgi:hypothetical protein